MKEGMKLEYKTLRDEILELYKRIQLIDNLYFATVFVTVGYIWETGSLDFLLAIPIISFFFGVRRSSEDRQIQKIGNYISNVIERQVEGLSWETYIRKKRQNSKNGI